MSIKIKYDYNLEYATLQSAGVDLRSSIDIVIDSCKPYKIPTSLFLEMPDNIECQVRSRSSIASKGIIILNSPGTIDADYRGEISILLYNLMQDPFVIKKGDRIAQLVFNEIIRPEFIKSDELNVTERGEGGFGSTGIL